jgi:hypothetical protein
MWRERLTQCLMFTNVAASLAARTEVVAEVAWTGQAGIQALVRVHWNQALFSLVNCVIYKYSKSHCVTEVISHKVHSPSNWNVLWIFALKLTILTWCFSSFSSGKWCHSTLKCATVTLVDPNLLCHVWCCSTHWKPLCIPWNPHLMFLNLRFSLI